MKSQMLKVTRGSGNVFRDRGYTDADAEQFKAMLAAEPFIPLVQEEGFVPFKYASDSTKLYGNEASSTEWPAGASAFD